MGHSDLLIKNQPLPTFQVASTTWVQLLIYHSGKFPKSSSFHKIDSGPGNMVKYGIKHLSNVWNVTEKMTAIRQYYSFVIGRNPFERYQPLFFFFFFYIFESFLVRRPNCIDFKHRFYRNRIVRMHTCQRRPTNYRLFLNRYNSANCYVTVISWAYLSYSDAYGEILLAVVYKNFE